MSQSPSRTGTIIQIGIAAIAAALLLSLLLPGRPVDEGASLPEMAVTGWLNDPPPDDLSGKVVLLDVWASWCGPCLAAMPDMVALYEKFAGEGVVFIGLTPEEPTAVPQIRAVVDGYLGLRWPIGYDAQETLDQIDWDNLLPTYIVYGRDGQVVWSGHYHEDVEDALVRALAK